jgi:L-asparaginase II
MSKEVAAATGVDPESLPSAVDGCGVQTLAAPLRAAAGSFVRLRELEGADRVIAAMQRRPSLLRGPIAADAVLMTRLEGWIAKGGAEGLLCASSPDGLGIALKVEDGAFRAIRPAFVAALELLGLPADGLADPALRNSAGEGVGEIRARRASA